MIQAALAVRPPTEIGAAGVGDPVFNLLGNGGYDARHYDVAMTYTGPGRLVVGTTTMTATATHDLRRFDLDFDGNRVTGIDVDGAPASYGRRHSKLVITPSTALAKGSSFVVTVDYVANPRARHSCIVPDDTSRSAWIPTTGGFYIAGQPSCTNSVFPSNDHPSDKASYGFKITVPRRLTAVASGKLMQRIDSGANRTFIFEQPEPMAAEVAQVVVGRYAVRTGASPHGITIRNVVPVGKAAGLHHRLSQTAGHIRWMEGRVGRYPFQTYGTLIAPGSFEGLELQTLSTIGYREATDTLDAFSRLQVHELAHQWFGDLVSPATWGDLWLNEGHATWYEIAYAARRNPAQLDREIRAAYLFGDQMRDTNGPVARPRRATLFSENVYIGGATVLYALRQRVGPTAFERIERAWVSRYANRSANTEQFIALGSSVSGQNLTPFLRRWLYGATTPPMPGHPSWTRASPRRAPQNW